MTLNETKSLMPITIKYVTPRIGNIIEIVYLEGQGIFSKDRRDLLISYDELRRLSHNISIEDDDPHTAVLCVNCDYCKIQNRFTTNIKGKVCHWYHGYMIPGAITEFEESFVRERDYYLLQPLLRPHGFSFFANLAGRLVNIGVKGGCFYIYFEASKEDVEIFERYRPISVGPR